MSPGRATLLATHRGSTPSIEAPRPEIADVAGWGSGGRLRVPGPAPEPDKAGNDDGAKRPFAGRFTALGLLQFGSEAEGIDQQRDVLPVERRQEPLDRSGENLAVRRTQPRSEFEGAELGVLEEPATDLLGAGPHRRPIAGQSHVERRWRGDQWERRAGSQVRGDLFFSGAIRHVFM